MAALPGLIDDVAAEIFFRLPPDEPENLVRACLVCKRWFRLLTDPDFLRCYRAFHRTPPLLGYLKRFRYVEEDPIHFPDEYGYTDFVPTTSTSLGLVPTTSASFAHIPYYRETLDCHHGRVLLRADKHDNDWYLVVWDPITGEEKHVPDVGCVLSFEKRNYSAAVCCAVSGCDHIDCHGGPFRVVFVAGDNHGQAKASMYSSETGEWSTPVTLGDDCAINAQRTKRSLYFVSRRSAIIGDEIYFTIWEADAIVKYDMRKNCLSMSNVPLKDQYSVALMEMEDGSLGFVYIRGSSPNLRLYVWSKKVNSEGAAEWVQCKVVKLGERIPVTDYDDTAYVVGAAEGIGVIFVKSDVSLFTIKLNSGVVKEIGEAMFYYCILPFMGFYTPDRGTSIASKAKDLTDALLLLRDVSKQ